MLKISLAIGFLVSLLTFHVLVLGKPIISIEAACAGPGRLSVSVTVTAESGESLTKVRVWLRKCAVGSNVWNDAETLVSAINPKSPYTWTNRNIPIAKDHYYTVWVRADYKTDKGVESRTEKGSETVGPCKDVMSVIGGDPPIWENIMAFPTWEYFLGQDLNGDGDFGDTVLRYMNIKTGEVVNTGATVSGSFRSISVYEDVIVFVGAEQHIRLYRISTGALEDTGMTGSHPSVYGDLVVFSEDERILFYDLGAAAFRGRTLHGSEPTIWESLVAYRFNGTLWYHDLATGATVDTGVVAFQPYLHGKLIAFAVPESFLNEDLNGDGDSLDWVIAYYDIDSGATVITGVEGSLPSVYGNIIVFATREDSVGVDLNNDGKILGSVIRYYEVTSGKLVNTGILGTEPSIYKDTITYFVWEVWINQDLTNDGDQSDPIVGYLRISDTVWGKMEEASK